MDLRDQLQRSLGDAYTLERELGGGGMSRVFVAEERRLGRRVVVKVLSPGLAAAVNTERFEREIRLVASLTQANIVPVLSAGETNGLPYYTMPFVEGESLRARLATRGPLPFQEVVSILHDVARALAYAHERGVVHRDIKPDNVLLSGGTAVVTDFGIAKAIWSARTEPGAAKLTQTGMAIGTPAYMAPEQVAGDPAIDRRADLYSLGCMAYELLSGRTPFTYPSVQQIVVAHLSEEPESLIVRCPRVPAALSQLVGQCLEKSPDARPGSADEIIARLSALGTAETATNSPDAETRILTKVGDPVGETAGPVPRIGDTGLRRALAFYAVACAMVVVVSNILMDRLALPDWVTPGSAVVMVLILPAILLTGFALRYMKSDTPTSARAIRNARWQRVGFGSAAALFVFVLVVAGYMTLRAYGIGAAGSLIGAGSVRPAAQLLVADFDVMSSDTLLSTALAEAVRTDLAQSRVTSIVQANVVADALVRMRLPATARLDFANARELARREGIKAIVHGSLATLGNGYLVTLRLVEAETGNELASFRTSVAGSGELIGALDVLARRLRGKVGESLRAVRGSPPLVQVTTASLPALRKYADGVRAADLEGDYPKAIKLLREATLLDTGFATAYRKLASALNNAGAPDSLIRSASLRAYTLRERLPDSERLLTEGSYFQSGPGQDLTKAARAYESLFEIDSTNSAMLNNLGAIYASRRDFVRAARMFRRASTSPGNGLDERENLFQVLIYSGDIDRADSVATAVYGQFHSEYEVLNQTVRVALARGLADSAQNLIDLGLRSRDPATRQLAMIYRADLALLHGQVANALDWITRITAFDSARGASFEPSVTAFTAAWADVRLRGRPEKALHTMDSELTRRPLQPRTARSLRSLTGGMLYAMSGKAPRARQILDEWRAASGDTSVVRSQFGLYELLVAEIALAENRPLDALGAFQQSDSNLHLPDRLGLYANLARAFDAAGRSDSTTIYYERYLSTASYACVGSVAGFSGLPGWDSADPLHRALALKRLGELYEATGDRQKAIARYTTFVELWKNADSDLQPTVTLARNRIAVLGTAGGR